MKVNLGGIVHLSTVDWTGSATTVIFLRGCPLRCPHCQNCSLQTGENLVDLSFPEGEIRTRSIKPAGLRGLSSAQVTLEKAVCIQDYRAPLIPSDQLISGIVLSGGEPLMQSEAARDIALNAHHLGLKFGLETCGYYPRRLEELLEDNLIDRVFLDVKAAFRDPEYERATGLKKVYLLVKESLRACMRAGVPLEVRTTLFPDMPTHSEIAEVANALAELKIEFPNNRLDQMAIQRGLPKGDEFIPVSLESLSAIAKSIKSNKTPVRIICRDSGGRD